MADEKSPIDPDDEAVLSEEQRAYIKKILERLMELGIGVVYFPFIFFYTIL